MNLIYMCVFNQESYINLLKLLITSISLKGNINKDTTDILIITAPSFQPKIKITLEGVDLPIHYYILDLHTLFDAGCARLNIFKYNNIHNYDTILYLDTDILVNSDVNILLNLELSLEKIYALEEGHIGNDLWGAQFFDFSKYDRNTKGFTSGILLFKNSDCMKALFSTIQLHIEDYIYINHNSIPACLDQPFIVYNALSQNKYDNIVLNTYVENNPSVVSSEKIVYHFPGGPGKYASKFSKMTTFWIKMNKKANMLDNKRYSWENNSILFLQNGAMDAFGIGNYIQLDRYRFEATFGGREHVLVFNNDFTEFISTRKGDNHNIVGRLMQY